MIVDANPATELGVTRSPTEHWIFLDSIYMQLHKINFKTENFNVCRVLNLEIFYSVKFTAMLQIDVHSNCENEKKCQNNM